MNIVTKFANIDGSLSSKRQVKAILTTSQVDRDGDVILPDGVDLSNWRATGSPILAFHDHARPVAKAISVDRTSTAIAATIQFPKEGESPSADDCYGLVKSGAISAMSIGFRPIKSAPRGTGTLFTEVELLEASFVPVPSNTGAIVVEKGCKSMNSLADGVEQLGQFARFAAVAAGNENRERTVKAAREIFGAGPVLKQIVSGIQKELNGLAGAAGGFALPTAFADTLINELRPLVALRAAGVKTAQIDRVSFQWPRLAGTGTGLPAWLETGASNPVPVASLTFALNSVSLLKLGYLLPIQNDWLRFAALYDSQIGEALLRGVAQAEDYGFLLGDGTAGTPIGLLARAKRIGNANASAGTGFPQIVADLQVAIKRVTSKNVPFSRPTWFMAPQNRNYLWSISSGTGGYLPFADEMSENRTLLGIPFRLTNSLDGSTVLLADLDQVTLFDGPVLLDRSTAGVWNDGVTVHNAFAEDVTLLRCLCHRQIDVAHDEAVAAVTNVAWTL